MNRRTAIALIASAGFSVRADSGDEVWAVLGAMVAGLAEDNAPAFLKPIDPKMQGYSELADNVNGMIEQTDVHSSIRVIRNEGDDAARTVEVDWELRLTRKTQGEDSRTEGRERAVTLEFRRDGKKWRVEKIEPLAFFAPAEFR